MREIDICPRRLEQLEIEPPKYSREGEIHLRVRQVDSDARARAAAEWHEVFLQPHSVAEPALGAELVRLREDGGIVVHEDRWHAHGRPGGNEPMMKRETAIGFNAL